MEDRRTRGLCTKLPAELVLPLLRCSDCLGGIVVVALPQLAQPLQQRSGNILISSRQPLATKDAGNYLSARSIRRSRKGMREWVWRVDTKRHRRAKAINIPLKKCYTLLCRYSNGVYMCIRAQVYGYACLSVSMCALELNFVPLCCTRRH